MTTKPPPSTGSDQPTPAGSPTQLDAAAEALAAAGASARSLSQLLQDGLDADRPAPSPSADPTSGGPR